MPQQVDPNQGLSAAQVAQRQQIGVAQLVLDDIVVYQTGDQIAADGRRSLG